MAIRTQILMPVQCSPDLTTQNQNEKKARKGRHQEKPPILPGNVGVRKPVGNLVTDGRFSLGGDAPRALRATTSIMENDMNSPGFPSSRRNPQRTPLRMEEGKGPRARLVNSPGSLDLGQTLASELAGTNQNQEDMDEEMETAKANRTRVQALREQLREFERVTADNAKVRFYCKLHRRGYIYAVHEGISHHGLSDETKTHFIKKSTFMITKSR